MTSPSSSAESVLVSVLSHALISCQQLIFLKTKNPAKTGVTKGLPCFIKKYFGVWAIRKHWKYAWQRSWDSWKSGCLQHRSNPTISNIFFVNFTHVPIVDKKGREWYCPKQWVRASSTDNSAALLHYYQPMLSGKYLLTRKFSLCRVTNPGHLGRMFLKIPTIDH